MERRIGLLHDYLSEQELADELGKTRRTLQRWRRLRVGPPVTYCGKTPSYYWPSAAAWLRGREIPMVRERRRDSSRERGRGRS